MAGAIARSALDVAEERHRLAYAAWRHALQAVVSAESMEEGSAGRDHALTHWREELRRAATVLLIRLDDVRYEHDATWRFSDEVKP